MANAIRSYDTQVKLWALTRQKGRTMKAAKKDVKDATSGPCSYLEAANPNATATTAVAGRKISGGVSGENATNQLGESQDLESKRRL